MSNAIITTAIFGLILLAVGGLIFVGWSLTYHPLIAGPIVAVLGLGMLWSIIYRMVRDE